ncbi:hypothetical protein [Pseudarthrobacter sp. IC2-21]|nr:hypothetical protein [Pseudarthrobacter sp. IC2-21]
MVKPPMMSCSKELLTIDSGTGTVDAFGEAMTRLGTQYAQN